MKAIVIFFKLYIYKIIMLARQWEKEAQYHILLKKQLEYMDLGFFEAEKSEAKLGGNVEVGKWTMVGRKSRVLTWSENEKVSIGKFCSIADEVIILGGGEHGHRGKVSTYAFKVKLLQSYTNTETLTRGIVKIGNDVWIGTRALIMSGVEIGDGAVIGMGAIVNKNIPPYAIVVGNPARIVDYRFSPEIIEKLLAIKWWNWENETIKERIDFFYGDIDIFVNKFYSINQ